jgi:hypothetical protein
LTKAMNEGLCKYARRQASDATKLRYVVLLGPAREMEGRRGHGAAPQPLAGQSCIARSLTRWRRSRAARTPSMSVPALVVSNRMRINTFALSARLPTVHFSRDLVEAGGLMSYGPKLPDLLRRAADYVDKILRGAKPGDIPVEQPTRFDLIINLTTAKALGLEISPLLLARTDEVIE